MITHRDYKESPAFGMSFLGGKFTFKLRNSLNLLGFFTIYDLNEDLEIISGPPSKGVLLFEI